MSDERRESILLAALQVFARYGFKKASMDEVARSADLSRPGLYLHFANKEALFRATVEFLVERALSQARVALASEGALEDRLVDAFVAVNGAFVGHTMDAAHFGELFDTAQELAADAVARFESEQREVIAEALRPRKRADELAEVLDLVSAGAKHRARTREEYAAMVRRGVRVVLGAT